MKYEVQAPSIACGGHHQTEGHFVIAEILTVIILQ